MKQKDRRRRNTKVDRIIHNRGREVREGRGRMAERKRGRDGRERQGRKTEKIYKGTHKNAIGKN